MPNYSNISPYLSSNSPVNLLQNNGPNAEASNNREPFAQNISSVKTVTDEQVNKPNMASSSLERDKKSQELSKQEYHNAWLKWEKQAPSTSPNEIADRKLAVKKLCDCLYHRNTNLNLKGLELSSLPILPPNITRLNVSYTPLKTLPPLPNTLKILKCISSKLESLPELPPHLEELLCDNSALINLPKLPLGLIMLSCDNNPLQSLPKLPSTLQGLSCEDVDLLSLPDLPSELISLYCDHNRLASLPELPVNLKALSCNDNYLVDLPELPPDLETLDCTSNYLVRLPSFPLSLRYITACNNLLVEFPEVPPSLVHINFDTNRLRQLPASFTRLSSMEINIDNNPLSDQTINMLIGMRLSPTHRNLNVQFSMSYQPEPEPERCVRPLTESVPDWFSPERKQDVISQFSAINCEENSGVFSDFIDRLKVIRSAQNAPLFKKQIAQWLMRLANSAELRKATFAIALDATESCDDRIALTWNNMQQMELIHHIENGQYDNKLPKLVAAGREMFRLEQLEHIAREKVTAAGLVDEIEVYLGFQTQLRAPLELTTATKKMYFFDVSGITEDDLKVAELRVKSAENHQFPEWLAQWSPWQKLLERTESTLWKKAYDKKIEIYDNAYQNRINTELEVYGLTNDADAERAIGQKIMQDIDKTIFESLTHSALANKRQASLLNKKWDI
ncbi:hypothetical protein M2263_001455 [Providencia alcalifaciens]|nr:hypothetical protein [Providencia alcalifaciens]